MKILVIRFSSIGDIVLTTPVVRCLKQQLPGAEIHYLTKPAFAVLLEHNPYVDKVHTLDRPSMQKIREMKQYGFDLVIDLHHNLRTLLFKSMLDIPAFSFDKLNFEKWVMVNLKLNILPDLHIVDRYMAPLRHLDISNDYRGLDYFLPENAGQGITLPETFIAFAIGGQHATKRMPNEMIVKICGGASLPVVLLGGKEDRENGEAIALAAGPHVKNLCGALSLNESAWVLSRASFVVTHDTGLMHIASAFRKKIISIWGNTIPAFGMTPYYGTGQEDIRSEIPGLYCRPCTKIGFDRCPLGHFRCMRDQDTAAIIFALHS